MHNRPHGTGTEARRHAVDMAVVVMLQTAWLASRPMILPIVTTELDVPFQVETVVRNVSHLADGLDRILESDTTLRRHHSDVVDVLFVVAMNCRLFAIQWSETPDARADTFNDDLRRLRREVDLVVPSL
jgi:hypothetical protein